MTGHQTSPPSGINPRQEGPAQDPAHSVAHDPQPVMASDTTQTRASRRAQSAAEARARVTAAEAFARTNRPWFKRKCFALPSAVVLVFLALMVSTGGNDPGIFGHTRSATELRGDTADNIPTGTLGQSVRDGRFAFTVTSPARYSNTITSRLGTTEKAQGVFVIVRADVTNIGYEPRNLIATDQFLVSDRGQRFATSPAISALAGAETIFLDRINPGHTVNDAPMLFDVPRGTIIASLELHDSVSSPGVKVKLF